MYQIVYIYATCCVNCHEAVSSMVISSVPYFVMSLIPSKCSLYLKGDYMMNTFVLKNIGL